MKKVMFMIVGMFFAASVNAASLNLSTFNQDINVNSTLSGDVTNTSTQARTFTDVDGAGSFEIGHHVVSAVDQVVEVEWSFNKQINLESASISLGGSQTYVQAITGAGYTFSMLLLAGQSYFFDVLGVSAGSPLTATLTVVSAVPIPAALFLFAPALLGFFGLRRKAAVAA